ncbi:hypothetical protein D1872_350040 [compost metagenome]
MIVFFSLLSEVAGFSVDVSLGGVVVVSSSELPSVDSVGVVFSSGSAVTGSVIVSPSTSVTLFSVPAPCV